MKRYSILLIVSFILVLVTVSGAVYLSEGGYRQDTGKLRGTLTVYTALPAEQVGCLSEAYEKSSKVKVNFVTMSEDELASRMKSSKQADAVLADSRLLQQLAEDGLLKAVTAESTDAVRDTMKHEHGFWNGVWYDPVVFCINKDYMKRSGKAPLSWQDLINTPNIRIGITDLMAADNAANIYHFLVANWGEKKALEYMEGLHPKVVQYAKYLSTPVRMAGMGETDVSVAVNSEVLRYIGDDYPLKIIYPHGGTAYTVTGVGMVNGCENDELVVDFIKWLLTDEPQLAMQNKGMYYVPANPSLLTAKQLVNQDEKLFEKKAEYSKALRRKQLDQWLKEVRFRDS